MLSQDPRSPSTTTLAALALVAGLGILALTSCGDEPTAPGWARDSLTGSGEILFLSNREGEHSAYWVDFSVVQELLPDA